MLRLRLAIEEHRADLVTEALDATGGVQRIVALNPERAGTGVVLAADVMPSVADGVMQLIRDWEIDDADYLLTRQEVVAPNPPHGRLARGQEFAWIEVMGEARSHSRPLGRYLALMSVAGVLAAIGVITDNAILIVGAMAVSPDILPICAACVGIVAGRLRLARRAIVTLLLGILITWGVAAGIAWGLQAVGHSRRGLSDPRQLASRPRSHRLLDVLVALAAGVAAMLSFETRAASAVGVAISVTTIPASALFGVTLGLGEVSVSWGAAGVLGGQRQRCSSCRAPRPWWCSAGWAHAAPPPPALSPGRPSGNHLHDHRPVAGAVVEVDQDQLLPGPERQAPVDHRDLLGGADQRGALVRVRVGVVVQPVVLVVARRLGMSRSSSVAQVGDPAGLELHRRDCGGGPTHEGGDQSIRHGSVGHNPLDVGGDVD